MRSWNESKRNLVKIQEDLYEEKVHVLRQASRYLEKYNEFHLVLENRAIIIQNAINEIAKIVAG